jgi:NAD(P)-dependent dehydrogenase (short-subunit alcohol dehydrogenase family)
LRDPSLARGLLLQTTALFGRIDILINNVSSYGWAWKAESCEDRTAHFITSNLWAAYHLTRTAFPAMKAMRWGRIINIPPLHVTTLSQSGMGFRAGRVSTMGLTEAFAQAGLGHGVTCNAIRPVHRRTMLGGNVIGLPGAGVAAENERLLVSADGNLRTRWIDDIGATVIALCGAGGAEVTGRELLADIGPWPSSSGPSPRRQR